MSKSRCEHEKHFSQKNVNISNTIRESGINFLKHNHISKTGIIQQHQETEVSEIAAIAIDKWLKDFAWICEALVYFTVFKKSTFFVLDISNLTRNTLEGGFCEIYCTVPFKIKILYRKDLTFDC